MISARVYNFHTVLLAHFTFATVILFLFVETKSLESAVIGEGSEVISGEEGNSHELSQKAQKYQGPPKHL